MPSQKLRPVQKSAPGLLQRGLIHRKSVISRIKNGAKAMKRPIYNICHLCFFNQVRMAFFCAMEDFMHPRKIS